MTAINLVMVARSDEQLKKVSAEFKNQFNVEIVTLAVDLFKPESAEEVYNTVRSRNIVVDFLVNDAGQGEYGKFVEYEIKRDIDLIHLNVVSLLGLTKLFLKDMLSRNYGRILQVSSLLGKYRRR